MNRFCITMFVGALVLIFSPDISATEKPKLDVFKVENTQPNSQDYMLIVWRSEGGTKQMLCRVNVQIGAGANKKDRGVFIFDTSLGLPVENLKDPEVMKVLLEWFKAETAKQIEPAEAQFVNVMFANYSFTTDGLVDLDAYTAAVISVNGEKTEHKIVKDSRTLNSYYLQGVEDLLPGNYFLFYQSKSEGHVVLKTIQFKVE